MARKFHASQTTGGGYPRHSQSGFTLVEVLVTLVIVAMVAAVAFSSLGQVFEARTRLRPYLDESEQTTLVADWFRKTVQALIGDYEDGPHRFAGSATEISGLTGSPLMGPPGTPTSFRWLVKYDAARDVTVLEYQEQSAQALQIFSWAGRAGAFAYYAEDRKWHLGWPPGDTDQGKLIPQLPQLIRLSGMAGGLLPNIVAAPRASLLSPLPPPPLFGQRQVR
jgi:prepilin-type N-terminal cleavage/methylation domain-containing protein